ncbi:uncharacterized protein LOC100175718 [Ciona intestinalis]
MPFKKRKFACFSCCGRGSKSKKNYMPETDSIHSCNDTESIDFSNENSDYEETSNFQGSQLLLANTELDCPTARTGAARIITKAPSPIAHLADVHFTAECTNLLNDKAVSFDPTVSPDRTNKIKPGNRTYRKTPHKDKRTEEPSIEALSVKIVQKVMRSALSYFLVTNCISRSLETFGPIISESNLSLEESSDTISCESSDDDASVVSQFVDDLLRDVIGKLDVREVGAIFC